MVACLVFIRPRHVASIVDNLTSDSRAAADFWLLTKWATNALLVLDIVTCAALPELIQFRSRVGFPANAVFFSGMTQMCADACAASLGLDKDLGMLEAWSEQCHFDLANYVIDGKLNVTTVLHMPLPHALLVPRKVWTTWMMPYLTGTDRRGHSYQLGAPLWSSAVDRDNSEDPVSQDAFGPSDMLAIADLMRSCLNYVPASAQILTATARHQIRVLQSMRDNCILHEAALTTRAFKMEVIIEACVIAGTVCPIYSEHFRKNTFRTTHSKQ